jgi:hypothetical protein
VVGIVRSRTQTVEFVCLFVLILKCCVPRICLLAYIHNFQKILLREAYEIALLSVFPLLGNGSVNVFLLQLLRIWNGVMAVRVRVSSCSIRSERKRHYCFHSKFTVLYELLFKKTKLNSMVCVRERTIPTERPPLVGEVIANLCG